MTHVAEMLRTRPGQTSAPDDLVAAIDACFDCAQTCTACADACLGEQHVSSLVQCIRLNLDCADVCATTGRLLSRQTATDWTVVRNQLQACIAACRACGDECEQHGRHGMEHCRVCAESCRRCGEACERLLSSVSR
jgi:hypothetical protein